jgi:hypothetical protein
MDPPDAAIGLCATCRYRRTIAAARSTFYLCERSFTDPRFPKYPRLPVVRCDGYTEQTAETPEPPEPR